MSVVVPNYNKQKTLAACLEAVFTQTHEPHEVIVVDDASTDGSAAIAARFPCRLLVFPDNRGVSAARNTGAAESTGDVLFFVDSDIALESTAIEQALRILRRDPCIGVVQGIYDKVPLVDDGPVEVYKTLVEHYWRFRNTGVAPVTLFALAAIPKTLFQQIGGFDERMRDAEDIEFGSHLPPQYRIWMSDRIVGRHDEVDRFWPWVSEQARRAWRYGLAMIAVRNAATVAPRRSIRTRTVSPVSPIACVLAAAGVPLGLLSPWLLAAPAAAYGVFIALNRDLLRFAVRERGPRFLPFFLAMHTVLQFIGFALIGLGVVFGLIRSRGGAGSSGSGAPDHRTDPAARARGSGQVAR